MSLGPLIFVKHGPQVFSIFFGIFFAALVLWIVGRLAIKCSLFVTKLSVPRLFPFIIVLCLIGTYAINNSVFDLKIMIVFGIMGYFFQKYGMPLSPFIISFILSPLLESSLRQALLITRGNLWPMFKRPIVIMFLLFAILSIIGIGTIRQEIKTERK